MIGVSQETKTTHEYSGVIVRVMDESRVLKNNI